MLALHALTRLVIKAPNRFGFFSAEVAELLLVAFVALYFTLPLAVHGASQLSQSFTAPLASEAHGHYDPQ